MINIGVLGSTNGTDLQAVIDAIDNKIINASIKVVISNRKNAFILKRAENHSIKARYISHKNKTRNEFDQEVTNHLKENDVELILLIGFMRILSNEFCHRWQDKILNVHPSLLPKYKGLNTHNKAIQNKDKYSGATVHIVNEKLDSGKIILQKKVKILKSDSVKSLEKKVLKIEHKIYPKAIIKLLATD